MCITIFTSCFDIPEFSKNKKKSYFFFSNSIQYVNGISEFQKKICISRDDRGGSFLDIIIAFLILIKLF